MRLLSTVASVVQGGDLLGVPWPAVIRGPSPGHRLLPFLTRVAVGREMGSGQLLRPGSAARHLSRALRPHSCVRTLSGGDPRIPSPRPAPTGARSSIQPPLHSNPKVSALLMTLLSLFPRAVLDSGDRERARWRRDREKGSLHHFQGFEAGGGGAVTQSAICSFFFFIPILKIRYDSG